MILMWGTSTKNQEYEQANPYNIFEKLSVPPFQIWTWIFQIRQHGLHCIFCENSRYYKGLDDSHNSICTLDTKNWNNRGWRIEVRAARDIDPGPCLTLIHPLHQLIG